MGESNHEMPAFVWVFMSEFSANGQRGAPTAIFHSKGQADDWINQEQIDGILYEFPIGVALVDHAEPVNGNQAFITKHHDKSSKIEWMTSLFQTADIDTVSKTSVFGTT